ncbi:MAG: hypothetical protein J5831_04620, partial [Bacteroidales bacterium]|nr:hypothetical protein [Bacteroidales bacterium]
MKHCILITALLLCIAALFLSFRTSHPSNDDQPKQSNYQAMWNTFDEHFKNDLPESAGKVLDEIEKKAVKDNNQPQLLKTILYRRKVMAFTVEDYTPDVYIAYAIEQLPRLETVEQALLHEEIARIYAEYLSLSKRQILQNLAIDGDLSKVQMKYWDKQSFIDRIDYHHREALKPVDALKAAATATYEDLYEEGVGSRYKIYEPTMFDFMLHRIGDYYRREATADDLLPEINTELWWLPAPEFVKADLGGNDKALYQCLRFYQALLDYNSENNPQACLYNDYRRYEFVNGILNDDNRYQQHLQRLIDENPGDEQTVDITVVLAQSLLRQYEKNTEDSTYFGNYRKAYDLCQRSLKAFPKKTYDINSIVNSIEQDMIDVSLNQIQLPGESIPAILTYRNMGYFRYRIIRLTEEEYKEYDRVRYDKRFEYLNKKQTVAQDVITLPKETDFRAHSSLIALPKLESGIYYLMVCHSENDKMTEGNTRVSQFQVSPLGFIIDEKDDRLDLMTVNRKTGHPVGGVTVELSRRVYNDDIREYERKILKTLKTDANGMVTLDQGLDIKTLFDVSLRKGNDLLLPNHDLSVPTVRQPSPYKITTLLTDRAIYRPGQTVYFKGIVTLNSNATDPKTPVTNATETVVMKDANYQEVAKATFTTDEYGGFSGSFVIPDNLLNGSFVLKADHGTQLFRVEEYKRPTFELSFERVKEQYKLNQPVTVHGSVDALAGFALDNVQYSYRVTRKTQFPWRCWWWWYPAVEDEQIDFGEGRTDHEGKFAITFNLKPSLKTKPQQQPLFLYEIEVTATSAQGETHSDTYCIYAGYNEVALHTDVPSLVEQGALADSKVYVTNLSGEPAKSRVARKIYRFEEDARVNYFEAFLRRSETDRQLLSDAELKKLFPSFSFDTKADRLKHKTLVYQDEISIDDKAPFYPGKTALKPGKYYIELTSLDDTLAVTAREFTVYSRRSDKLPVASLAWIDTDKSTAHPGETVRFRVGTSATDAEMWVQLVHGDEVRLERHLKLNNNIVELSYTVREDDRDGLLLKTAIVKDNCYKTKTDWVSVPYDNLDLNVALATVRDKLSPGSEETWTVRVKDYKDQPAVSALVASMYDASLDFFARNYWSFNMRPNGVYGDSFRNDLSRFFSLGFPVDHDRYVEAFSFTLPSAKPFFGIYSHIEAMEEPMFRKSGAVVYDMVQESNAAGGAVLMASVEDEEAMVEELISDDAGTPSQKEPAKPKEEEPSVRENFNETAFFFPNLRTEADGTSSFTFTLPDAITRWRLMMLAYNNQGQAGYKEYEFKASKPVMIMADMPRYLYDTDTMWFVANVINTGDETVTPKAKLEVFDAVTMKPLDLLLSDAVIPMKEIVPGRSQEVRWKVAAKYDLSLIALRFTAYAGQFSDAEQHLLPVLSSEIFLTQTLPITVKADREQTFDFDAIANPASHERDYALTLNFSTNPVWYAVQALPSLANVNTKQRPEAAFYVFYANTLSAHIANHIPNLMAYIKKWQIETPDALLSQLEKDQDLKAILLQETPWVLEAKSEREQRSRIATLFEVNNLRQQQHETLELLEKTQLHGGGWPWFEGMPESPYITAYILSGFGKLKKMDAWTFMNKGDQNKAERICENAVQYLEYHVAEVYRKMKYYNEDWGIGGGIMDDLYALSFFKEQKSDKDFAKAKSHFLEHLGKKKEWLQFNFADRAEAAMLLYRNGDQKTAKAIIASFKETAMKNDQIGMYWPKRYFSWMSHVATHAQIMTAFAEIDQDQETLDKLKVWLLTQKQTTMWENSASTAEACYALLMRGSDWLDDGNKQVTLRFGETPISTEGGVAGTGFIQRHWNANEVTEEM